MNLFVLAGTEDGRLLASELKARGHEVWVSTLTEYGAQLAEDQGLRVRHGALDEKGLLNLLEQHSITHLIDATHPYAEKVHGLAQDVCKKVNLPYLRWERPGIDRPKSPLIHWVRGLDEAGQIACELGQRIFLSTGSKNLPEWLALPEFKEREIFVRVLPKSEVLLQCEALGLKPYQIIAAQGPFTQHFNEALWEQLQVDVVITKESGQVGGTEEKIRACLCLGIPVVILERPQQRGYKEQELSKGKNSPSETIEEFVRRVEKLK